jgi:hypothetical protein
VQTVECGRWAGAASGLGFVSLILSSEFTELAIGVSQFLILTFSVSRFFILVILSSLSFFF